MTDAAALAPLPPEQKRFTSGEVCTLCAVEAHTLRYWERAFPQLADVERRRGRRYYTREQVLALRRIKALKDEGLTNQAIIDRLGANTPRAATPVAPAPAPAYDARRIRDQIQQVIKLLEG